MPFILLNKVSMIYDSYTTSPGFPTVTQVAGGNPNVRPVAGEAQMFLEGSLEAFGIAIDNSGNIFVSDPYTHVILKIVPTLSTSNLSPGAQLYAGTPAVSGNNTDTPVRPLSAYFNTPRGLACDAYGNLFVADTGNNQIRKISPDGWVTLIAGDPNGIGGYVNGTSARFRSPWDVAVDTSNNIYVADTTNNCIRLIRNDTTYTFAGTTIPGDQYGNGTDGRFRQPRSVCVDASGMLFVADYGNYKIKRITQNGDVLRYCGTGVRGTTAGASTVAQFLDLYTLTCDRSGNVYVLDYDETVGARLIRLTMDGYSNVIYNFNTIAGQPYVIGVDVNRSQKLFIIESGYAQHFYSSSSSTSSSVSSGSSSTSSSNSSSSVVLSRSSESSSSTEILSRSSASSSTLSSASTSSSSTEVLSRSSASTSSTSSSYSSSSEILSRSSVSTSSTSSESSFSSPSESSTSVDSSSSSSSGSSASSTGGRQ